MKKYLFLCLTAVCILTSCGKTIDKVQSENNDKISENAAVTSETTAQTTLTEKTTAVVSTTVTTKSKPKKPKEKIPEDVVIDTLSEIEVYSDITVSDFVTEINAEIDNEDLYIDTSDIGEKSVDIEFTYKDEKYVKTVSYYVVDTTDPVALNMGWNPYTKVDEPFDINSVVGFVDNYDRSPSVSYSGEVDTSEIGTYPITVTVEDSSGNSTQWDMDILVLSEIPAPVDNNERLSFQEFMDKYCYENVSYGIDVSAWQTNVDYEKVREQGCEFVLMRMGYCYSEITKDDYYEQNIKNASAAGLDIGVYFYTTANTEEKARNQAKWIVEQLDGRELDYPVAFDWEEWGRFQQYGMNIHDLNEIFEAFCDELEKHGYTGMLYSSKNFLNNFWQNKNNRTVWLAHYVDETDYEGQFSIWQASAYGRMEGIAGDVDMNIRLNDMPV